ncbi:MAG TPA: exodeoxyribonuclease VII large subunit, partial [Candidatus Limnocylindrales bacterium]|nr:exodeoxyribonuclease VII large subunit [Candidatus Limnocylindrales bacterium]
MDTQPGAAARPGPATQPGGAGSPITAPGTFGLRILSVGEVARVITATVRAEERLRDLWIEGEIGRVTISSAGHAYFALKDERAALQCVWFRDDRIRSAFQAQTGLRIVAHGRIELYEPQGALQLYVESIQPSGVGDLAIRFEQLKARLAAEGLFDPARKRPLPPRPRTIAVVSSPTGAAWKDVLHVLGRRWPLVRVLLVSCKVQGDGAAESIVTALRRVERFAQAATSPDDAPALTILARGGGSMEDLWAFNDERVVRAIVAHTLPVVAGVGHEIDVTLADFAADVRAPTPSAAAELVVPDQAEFAAALARGAERMHAAAARVLAGAAREVDVERRALDRLDPASRLTAARQRAGELLDRATRAMSLRLADAARAHDRLALALPGLAAGSIARSRGDLATAAAALAVLGPQATLDRGYAIARRSADGSVVITKVAGSGG